MVTASVVCIAVVAWRMLAVVAPAAVPPVAPKPASVSTRAAAPAPALAQPAPAADATDYRGFRGSVVRFADVAAGRAALSADDDWIAATSELQRASLMGVKGPATREAFRAFQAQQVLPWPAATRQRMLRAMEQVAPVFNRLGIALPPEVLLVHTNGKESVATPHTRGPAFVYPLRFDQQSFSDGELLAHEFWHIVSRHNPALRTRLYQTIGFVPAAPLEWPAAWLPLRLANQDAPHHEHMMWVTLGDRPVALMPVVVADPAELRSGGTIVTAARTRLLEVIPGSGGQATRAVLRKGQPVWHDPDRTPAYLEKLGGNSDYLVHPEETMADNIMFLVSGRKVPNPRLQAQIEAALRGS